ncbi:hypothetical protein GCM10009730_62160 [Streptomyces albidochromogenes]
MTLLCSRRDHFFGPDPSGLGSEGLGGVQGLSDGCPACFPLSVIAPPGSVRWMGSASAVDLSGLTRTAVPCSDCCGAPAAPAGAVTEARDLNGGELTDDVALLLGRSVWRPPLWHWQSQRRVSMGACVGARLGSRIVVGPAHSACSPMRQAGAV